jgi:hypothetical protein
MGCGDIPPGVSCVWRQDDSHSIAKTRNLLTSLKRNKVPSPEN